MLVSSASGLPWPIPSQFQLQMCRAVVSHVLGELGSVASHWIGLLLLDLVPPMTPSKAAPSGVVRSAHPMARRHAAGRFKPIGEPDGHWGAGQSTVSMAACSPGIGWEAAGRGGRVWRVGPLQDPPRGVASAMVGGVFGVGEEATGC